MKLFLFCRGSFAAGRVEVKILTLVIVFLLLAPYAAKSQMTGVWEVCDTSASANDYWNGHAMLAAAPNDIAELCRIDHPYWKFGVRRTTDSGTTWHVVYSQDQTGVDEWRALAHPDAGTYIVAGDSLYPQYTGTGREWYWYQSYLIVSRDSGQRWEKIEMDSNTVIGDIIMLTANYGAAIEMHFNNRYDSLAESLGDSLLITNDCWRTWTSRPLPREARSYERLFSFRPGWFGTYSWEPSDYGVSYFWTADSGITWMKRGSTPQISDVYYLNEKVAWAIDNEWTFGSDRTTLLQSLDGGWSWQPRYTDTTPIGHGRLWYIAFADSLHGIATGERIMRTTDGGATWIADYPPSGAAVSSYIGPLLYVSPDLALAQADYTFVTLRYRGRQRLTAPFFHDHDPGPLPLVPTTISWGPVHGATKYRLQIAGSFNNVVTNDAQQFRKPLLDKILTDTSIEFDSLSLGYTYIGRLKAIGLNDSSDWRDYQGQGYSMPIFKTVDEEPIPGPPTVLEPHDGDHIKDTLHVRFTSVDSATSYSVTVYMYAVNASIFDTTMVDTTLDIDWLPFNRAYSVSVSSNLLAEAGQWSQPTEFYKEEMLPLVVNSVTEERRAVYPNPADEELHVPLDPGVGFYLYNPLGQRFIAPFETNGTGSTIDTRALPPGTYSLDIPGHPGQAFRFVVRH